MSQRTREIGIRVALGAEAAGVVAMVLRQGLWPIAGGLAAGLAALALSGRLIQGFMFSLPAVGPATPFLISAAIATVALVAMALPVRRALSVDPASILRAD
jgi:ABC-type antimicrobial peptide transport system permease subunit